MESKDYSLVKSEVELLLSELNKREVLSSFDKIEIKDHFYCDIEELVLKGLSTQEALLVAKSRFGELDKIREDYESVKQDSGVLYFVLIGVLLFSVFKGLFVAVNLTAKAFWVSVYIYNSNFIENNFWMDIPLRFIVLVFGLKVSIKFIRIVQNGSISKLWYIPLLYIALELINRIVGFIIIPGINPYAAISELRTYGILMQNETFVGIIALFILTLVVSFKLFQQKKDEHRFV